MTIDDRDSLENVSKSAARGRAAQATGMRAAPWRRLWPERRGD